MANPFQRAIDALRSGIDKGHFRCAYGFLAALRHELDCDASTLVLLDDPKGENKPDKIWFRYPQRRDKVTINDLDRWREEIDDKIRTSIDSDRQLVDLWKQKCFEIQVSCPVHLDSVVKAKYASRTAAFTRFRPEIFKYSNRKPASKEPDSARDVGIPTLLLRVWPARGWPFPKHRGVWVCVINPRIAFAGGEDHLKTQEARARTQLTELLGVWFSRKGAILQERGWLKAEDDAKRTGQAYAESIVWPVTGFDFANLLDDFCPPKDLKGEAVTRWPAELQWLDQLDGLSSRICGADQGEDKPGCANCPGKDGGCPQHSHPLHPRYFDEHIRTLALLHRWSPVFCRHWVQTGLPPEAGAGLTQAAQLLDAGLGFSEAGHRARRERAKSDGHPIRDDDIEERRRYERKLLKFFVSRAISDSAGVVEKLKLMSPLHLEAPFEYPAALGRIATVLLTNQAWTAERIEWLIDLLAGYCHRILGIPDRVDIAAHLRQTLRGEGALHTLKQRYRDHFFHTIEVCLIGHWFLLSHPKGSPRDWATLVCERCKAAKQPGATDCHVPKDREEFLANWWLAALTHDAAYGIDVLQATLNLLGYFNNGDKDEAFAKGVKKCVQEQSARLAILEEVKSGFEKPGKSLDDGDHGLITAGHLIASLDKISEETKRRYVPAIRAVAFHNSRIPKVDARKDPVAALLILCDTMQDWGRSQLGFSRSPAEVLSRIVEGGNSPSDEQFGPVERFFFSMPPAPELPENPLVPGLWKPQIHEWSESDAIEFTLQYAPWMTDKIDCREKVIFGWADTVYNLQRVDFSGWGIKLSIVHDTPYAHEAPKDIEPRTCGDMTEMERFAHLIQEQSAWFLKPWLDAASESLVNPAATSGIKYDSDSTEKRERTTFDLLTMGKRFLAFDPLMAGHAGMLGEVMKQWSKRQPEPPTQKPPR